ncbi:hypothetical protein SAMN05216312_10484 [Cohnella sp. OV330]|uniref:hypothetical protein n=1 Tax=Cohnella sp. OV330 TaxID=1855288 RepID=UPI0008E1552E|nr:hypothetical protein [Cohnella sp. OV330]SFB15455.1 hypothetical protein SAMN05216312_10484 [Cohnella sp. OV330]
MTDRTLLKKGLTVIASCRERTGDIWEAHFGAAAIAAYFFIAENRLDDDVARKIAEQADRMVTRRLGEPVNLVRADPDMADREAKRSANDDERVVVEALEETIDGLHWVGHNAIYAAASLKAIRELDGWGAAADVEAISQLIRSFKGKIPGRSWIGYKTSEVKALTPPEEGGPAGIEDGAALSRAVLQELAAFGTIYRAEAHHDLIGHMLTFSHALVTLEELGYPALFKRGLLPLFKLVRVLRASRYLQPGEPIRLFSPVDREPLALARPSTSLPTESAFWDKERSGDEWDFGHAFKFPYSFYHHAARAGGADAAAYDRFRRIVGT